MNKAKSFFKEILYKLRRLFFYPRVKNRHITIFSNDCSAGFIYHHYGLRFESPTINLLFEKDQFLYFVNYFSQYVDATIVETTCKYGCPAGLLIPKDKRFKVINLFFYHYPDFESAKEVWLRRINRVNLKKVLVVWNNTVKEEHFNDNNVNLFLNLPYRKICICNRARSNKGIECSYETGNNRYWSYKNTLAAMMDNRFLFEYDFLGVINEL